MTESPPTARAATPEVHVPLDEVMLAMDVVDTLRHQQEQIEAELGGEQRERQLTARIKSIYAAQGIEVDDAVIAQGVEALVEDRFRYTPPERGFAVRVAEVYVERGRWAWRALLAAAVVGVLWLAIALPAYFRRQALIESFGNSVTALQRQAEQLTGRAQGLQRDIDAARAGPGPEATKLALQRAERALHADLGEIGRLQKDLGALPSAGLYPERKRELNELVVRHRNTAARLGGALDEVARDLRDSDALRGVNQEATQLLRTFDPTDVPEGIRTEIRALHRSLSAAIAAGDLPSAMSGLQSLRARIEALAAARHARQRNTAKLERLRAQLAGLELDSATSRDLDQLERAARAAVAGDDPAIATTALERLGALVGLLDQSYELRIVSAPGRKSGVTRRVQDRRDAAQNYYVVVEARGANGRPVTLDITSEEDQRSTRTSTFGIRVPKSVYDSVRADKRDNGIVDDNLFGTKVRGARAPTYRFPTAGGNITRGW
ncbi:MAG: hypothetical protein KDC87_08300 [Planctomycetes bacterium]|nr:hypothetical protein [Planctomycetota bacterium]MCB9868215.1 hypothetical protein [Planctomycetota bacterium]